MLQSEQLCDGICSRIGVNQDDPKGLEWLVIVDAILERVFALWERCQLDNDDIKALADDERRPGERFKIARLRHVCRQELIAAGEHATPTKVKEMAEAVIAEASTMDDQQYEAFATERRLARG